MPDVVLRRFTKELEGSKGSVDYHQIWRYTKGGKMPRVLMWLALHPNLARALADDADEIANQSSPTNEERPAQ
jgi:hypothetical protein